MNKNVKWAMNLLMWGMNNICQSVAENIFVKDKNIKWDINDKCQSVPENQSPRSVLWTIDATN